MTTKTAIEGFVSQPVPAVAGVSRDPKKFGTAAYRELKGKGYRVLAINPNAHTIEGDPCYPSLKALPEKVDGLLLCTQPAASEQLLRDAAAAGLSNVWLQAGAGVPELLALAQQLGLNVVSGKCILMYAPPVRAFHWWHRAFCQVTGKL